MRFANVGGERIEAAKGLLGLCQGCDLAVIPVCGTKRAWHWRHKVDCECDRWWENETEWHREWKNNFSKEYQEIRQRDEATGEWHIADVKTKHGYILEFQHSYLKSEERQARNNFYGEKLVWVVDGLARKSDWSKFESLFNSSTRLYPNLNLFRINSVKGSPLATEWSECKVPVFFDFGVDRPLICLLPKSSNGNSYFANFARQGFIELLNESAVDGRSFSDWMTFFTMRAFAFENPEIMAVFHASQAENSAKMQVQAIRPVATERARLVVPGIRLQDFNYLMRPRRPINRRGRRF